MAYEERKVCLTFVAGADLRALQYCAVALSTAADGTVIAPGGQGAKCIGILQNEPDAGQEAEVCVHGVSYARGGAGVTRGGDCAANDTDGELGAASSGDFVLGQVVESLADGVLGSVLVNPAWVPLA